VQEKAIAYPADARVYHVMRGKLVKLAKILGVGLRQSYERVSKKAFCFPAGIFTPGRRSVPGARSEN
jgi:hypothetical protein